MHGAQWVFFLKNLVSPTADELKIVHKMNLDSFSKGVHAAPQECYAIRHTKHKQNIFKSKILLPDHQLEDAFQEPQLKTSVLFVSSGASA